LKERSTVSQGFTSIFVMVMVMVMVMVTNLWGNSEALSVSLVRETDRQTGKVTY